MIEEEDLQPPIVIHNPEQEDSAAPVLTGDFLLSLCLSQGRGRPIDKACCLGCEFPGITFHIMAGEDADDPRAIRIYSRNKKDHPALAAVGKAAALRELYVIQETPRPGRRDLVIYVE